MRLIKILTFIMIIAGNSLFANNLNTICNLVNQINHTDNIQIKIELIKQLDKSLFEINKDDLLEALHIINKKVIS